MSAPGSPKARNRARAILLGLAVLVAIPSLLWWLKRDPAPAIATTGLDPAVARLITETVAAVRAAPHSGEAWGKLGSVLMHYAFLEESGQAFDRAEQLSPVDARWPHLHGLMLLSRDAPGALPKLRLAVDRNPQADAPRLRLAQVLAELGRGPEAEEHFTALLRANAAAAPASLGLARILLAQDRPADATNLLERCLSDPHTAKAAWAVLANARLKLGDAPGAQAASRRSAALPVDAPWPDPVWNEALAFRVGRLAWIADASALLDQGRVAEALEPLAIVTREYPDDPEPWYLAGWALNQLNRGAEAERSLREHLRREPQSARGHAQLAVALLAQRRPAEALEVLQAAVRLKPTWRELHSNLGFACVQLGRDDEALGHYREALAIDPNFVPTYTALAELLLRRGRRDEAQPLVRQARERSPEDPRVQSLIERLDAARP